MVRPLAVGVSILTLASSSAFAQPPASEPEVVTTSYRNQILIASGIGVASFLGAAIAEGPNGEDTPAFNGLWNTGLISSFLAPPIIHFAHGELDRGVGSLALRWAGASLFGLISMRIGNCNPDTEGTFCNLSDFAPGALVGIGIASVIEAFTMTDQKSYRTRPTERVLAPVVSASGSGGQLGLAGTF